MLDIEMPGQSGLAALPLILTKGRNAKIIMLSSNCDEGSAAAIEALAMGASDIMAKPGRSVFGGQFPDLLIERLLKLGTQARWQSAPSDAPPVRSEEHTSELQSLMRISYAVLCLQKKNTLT